jgi:hypothetical protein
MRSFRPLTAHNAAPEGGRTFMPSHELQREQMFCIKRENVVARP